MNTTYNTGVTNTMFHIILSYISEKTNTGRFNTFRTLKTKRAESDKTCYGSSEFCVSCKNTLADKLPTVIITEVYSIYSNEIMKQ